jgi:5-methylcytosine-specific restriction protein B
MKTKSDIDAQEQHYWKISPGSKGEGWKDCLKAGRIGIGWIYEDIHGLNEKELEVYIQDKINRDESKKIRQDKIEEIIHFVFNIKKNDIVVAYSAPSTIYGIGIVEEDDWIFDDQGNYYLTNSRKVRWLKNVSPTKIVDKLIVQNLGKQKTVIQIDKDIFIQRILPLFEKESEVQYLKLNTVPASNLELIHLLKKKSQLVFYGPPGTGKTYTARQLSVSLIENHFKEI